MVGFERPTYMASWPSTTGGPKWDTRHVGQAVKPHTYVTKPCRRTIPSGRGACTARPISSRGNKFSWTIWRSSQKSFLPRTRRLIPSQGHLWRRSFLDMESCSNCCLTMQQNFPCNYIAIKCKLAAQNKGHAGCSQTSIKLCNHASTSTFQRLELKGWLCIPLAMISSDYHMRVRWLESHRFACGVNKVRTTYAIQRSNWLDKVWFVC